MHGCARVCTGAQGCARVCKGVHMGMHGMHRCVWDEFSEYLLETRVLTSSDFNVMNC